MPKSGTITLYSLQETAAATVIRCFLGLPRSTRLLSITACMLLPGSSLQSENRAQFVSSPVVLVEYQSQQQAATASVIDSGV